jgi:hypothetical protein
MCIYCWKPPLPFPPKCLKFFLKAKHGGTSTEEVEVGESQVQAQTELHSKTLKKEKRKLSQALMAHTCIPSHMGDRDQEDHD